jgi:hypothetical protein
MIYPSKSERNVIRKLIANYTRPLRKPQWARLFPLLFASLPKLGAVRIGEGPEYRPFHDLRSVPEAGRPREQVENLRRACTQVLFLSKAELGFFHFLTIKTGWRSQ